MSEPTPENTEQIAEAPEASAEAPETREPESTQAEPPPEKRRRGRPAGAKDKAKRVVKPRVRVEPIAPAETQPSQPEPSQPPTEPVVQEPVEEPSPRTLFRHTSAQLLHLRGIINDSRRSATAQQYTQKLSVWPVV